MNEETQVIDLGMVNAYLIKAGDGYILIDTGTPQLWPTLEKTLIQAGCLPNHLKLVILTHGDTDHAGNCAELQKKYHAKIAVHAGDVDMVKGGKPLKRKARGLVGWLIQWLGNFMTGNERRFEPDVLLQDRQPLSNYGLAGRVIHAPGHTPGSIFVLTDDGRLFSGDLVSKQRKLGITPLIHNEKELQNSLDLLKSLQAHTVYPGHGKPFEFKELASFGT